MLEEAVISPFYLDKIKDDQGIRVPSVLSMSILFMYYYYYYIVRLCFINMKYSLMQTHIPLSTTFFILHII